MAASCRRISLDGTGWGAWEVGDRVSMMDLNNAR